MKKIVQITVANPCPPRQEIRVWGALLRFGSHTKPYAGSTEQTDIDIDLVAIMETARKLTMPCHIEAYTRRAMPQDGSGLNKQTLNTLKTAINPHSIEWFQAQPDNLDMLAATKAACSVAQEMAVAWSVFNGEETLPGVNLRPISNETEYFNEDLFQ